MEQEEKNKEKEKEPVKVSLAENNKEDQENFQDAVYEAQIKADITFSDTGQELMDELNDKSTPNPDVIFMDQHMTLDNGNDVLKEIKKDDDLKDIPTIIYADSSGEKDIDAAYKDGANLYVQKPIFFRNLVRILLSIFTLNWLKLFSKRLRKDFVMGEAQINEEPAAPTATEKLVILKKNITTGGVGRKH